MSQPAEAARLERLKRWSAWTTRSALAALMGLLTLWLLWIAPPAKASPGTILAIHLLPLAGFIPAIWRGRPRPHAWLCFLVLIYFCEGVLFATANHPQIRTLGILQALVSATLFVSAMLYARWQSRWLKTSGG